MKNDRLNHWLRNATEAELLTHLQDLIDHSQRQQGEIMSLVETIAEDSVAMQSQPPPKPRSSWLTLGLAGLAGYVIGRRRGNETTEKP